MSQLSEALKKANRNSWSYRQIEREANRHGHTLAFTTVGKYMRGDHPETPSGEVLQAFADAFGVSVNILLRAAGQHELNEPFVLPDRANALDPTERRAVLQMIDTIVRAKTPARPAAGEDATVHQLHPERDHLAVAAYTDASDTWARRRAQDEARGEEPQDFPDED